MNFHFSIFRAKLRVIKMPWLCTTCLHAELLIISVPIIKYSRATLITFNVYRTVSPLLKIVYGTRYSVIIQFHPLTFYFILQRLHEPRTFHDNYNLFLATIIDYQFTALNQKHCPTHQQSPSNQFNPITITSNQEKKNRFQLERNQTGPAHWTHRSVITPGEALS